VEAGFGGADNTSDADWLSLDATDRAIGLFGRFAAGCADRRVRLPGASSGVAERRQGRAQGLKRWLRTACAVFGHEDLVDHDQRRHDPVLATLTGKLTARHNDCAPRPLTAWLPPPPGGGRASSSAAPVRRGRRTLAVGVAPLYIVGTTVQP
jgi:hypothetical protein